MFYANIIERNYLENQEGVWKAAFRLILDTEVVSLDEIGYCMIVVLDLTQYQNS